MSILVESLLALCHNLISQREKSGKRTTTESVYSAGLSACTSFLTNPNKVLIPEGCGRHQLHQLPWAVFSVLPLRHFQ